MSLYDELNKKQGDRIGENVGGLGGDLYDELGIKTNDQSLLSSRFTEQDATDERRRLLDQINDDMNGFEKFLVGAGRGFTSVARGVGLAGALDGALTATGLIPPGSELAEPEAPIVTQAFNQLTDDSLSATIGEVVGEASPFLAAVPLSGAGLTTAAGTRIIPAAKTLAGKVAGAVGLGAAEGSIIARGRGGDGGDIIGGAGIGGILAGGIEAVSPVLGRLVNSLFRRLGREPKGPLLGPDGQPTPEFTQVLEETGTSFSDLTQEAFTGVNKQGIDPEQAARKARFDSQGIPATKGDITQFLPDQAKEQRLISQAAAVAGEPLRQLKLEQSQAFTSKVDDLVNALGVPDRAGQAIKDALIGRKKLLKKETRDFYAEFRALAPEAAETPILTQSIRDSIPDKDVLDDLSVNIPVNVEKVRLAMARFGIDTSQEAAELLDRKGLGVQILTIGNHDRLRKMLGNIARDDVSGASTVLTGDIIEAVDVQAEIAQEVIGGVAGVPKGALESLKSGRATSRQVKTEFAKNSIVGRLVDIKRNAGDTPVIEASRITRELLKADSTGVAKIENLQRTLESLRKAGKPGRMAIKDLQASVVLNALEDSFKSLTQKTGGVQTFSGVQFAKSLNDIGDKKLELIFEGNEKVLNKLMNFKQTALDITPDTRAVPKGSASVILDILAEAAAMPLLGDVQILLKMAAKPGFDDRAVRKAMKSSPKLTRIVSALERDFPALASSLGIVLTVPKQDEEN